MNYPAWYRNAERGRFHAEGPDFVRSGRALCGAKIPRPSRFWWPDGNVPIASKACRKCIAAVAKAGHGVTP